MATAIVVHQTETNVARWKLIETWAGTTSASAKWELIETWTGAVVAPAEWELVGTWAGTVQASVLPLDYYNVAVSYVAAHYEPVSKKDIANLANFLDNVLMGQYEENVFDCSNASAMLEWLLEGEGFNASLATTSAWWHMWILVTLDDGSVVAVESTHLLQNNYFPPGIVETPSGNYREYTYLYKAFLQWKNDYHVDITFEEWRNEYVIGWDPSTLDNHYNPAEIYASPADAVTQGHYSISEYDWWKAPPYDTMEPFSEWN